jgi:hypothetical protein
MNRRLGLAAAAFLAPVLVFVACSSDDSASSPGDGGTTGDSTTSGGDGSSSGDGNTTGDGSTGGDSSLPPPKKCGGAAPGSFSGEIDRTGPIYASGYSVFYDGLLDAGIGSFSVACAFTDAGLVSALPCPVGVDTVQDFPNDGLQLTLNPSAMDASSATLTATVADD